VALVSSIAPAQAEVPSSLEMLLSAASSGSFFDGRADPSLPHRLLDGVELQSQRLGNFCRAGATGEQPLDLAHHIINQHRRATSDTRGVKAFRPLLAVRLYGPLHADRRHPKGADDVALLDMTVGAELAGDHAKRGDVVLSMAEYGHVPVEVRDLAILLHEGQLAGDVSDAIGEYGQLQLGHGQSRAAATTPEQSFSESP
jgi:hypothetical protein